MPADAAPRNSSLGDARRWHWLLRHGETPCRFDCLLLESLDADKIEWLRDAFSAD